MNKCLSAKRGLTHIDIKLTTGYDLRGFQIADYLGIVSGEYVIGTDFLYNNFAQVTDSLDVVTNSFSMYMNQAREYVLGVVRAQAEEKMADAVIGIRFDYFSVGRDMICISCSGTAVELIAEDPSMQESMPSVIRKKEEEALHLMREGNEAALQTSLISLKRMASQCDSIEEIQNLFNSFDFPETPEIKSLLINLNGMAEVERHVGVNPKAVQSIIDQINKL